MYFKIVFNLVAILFMVILQLGFISALPGIFSDINLLLLSQIFVLFLFNSENAFVWALCFGLLRDSFSYSPLGLYFLSFVLSLFLANFLLNNFFTNRSLYSFLALSASSILSYKVVLYSMTYIFNTLGLSETGILIGHSFWANEGRSLFVNLSLTIIVFYIINFLSKRLKPAFLLKR